MLSASLGKHTVNVDVVSESDDGDLALEAKGQVQLAQCNESEFLQLLPRTYFMM